MANHTDPSKITDAVDFYKKWPILRHRAERLIETRRISAEDAELLHWMIVMVDMVGPNDINRDR